jgi:hypothetical protein
MTIPFPFDLYDVARFFSKVDVKKEKECWEYRGWIGEHGYGVIKIIDSNWLAHRVSYTLFYGHISPDLVIRHKCDNKSCVNPYHLETGTQQDNVMDCVIRNRTAKGSKNGRAKITEQQAMDIFKDTRSYVQISKDYPITKDMVSRIKMGIAWGHVTGATPPAKVN